MNRSSRVLTAIIPPELGKRLSAAGVAPLLGKFGAAPLKYFSRTLALEFFSQAWCRRKEKETLCPKLRQNLHKHLLVIVYARLLHCQCVMTNHSWAYATAEFVAPGVAVRS